MHCALMKSNKVFFVFVAKSVTLSFINKVLVSLIES